MTGRLNDTLDALADARARRVADSAAQTAQPLDLFGPVAELAAVTEAIEAVHAHTSEQWKRDALAAVRAAAERLDEFTVDAVRWPDCAEPYDERARGAVMRRAAVAGFIRSTKTYTVSDRPETHRRPMLVWRSRLRGAQ